MVPFKFSPIIYNGISIRIDAAKFPRDFKQIGGGAIAEVEGNTATVGTVVGKVKPYKQSIAGPFIGRLNCVISPE